MSIRQIFSSNHERYEGVRPINIYLLRTIYFLMAAFVATSAWSSIFRHEGAWDPHKALAICVWATYPAMALFGVIHPLRMLPIMIFMVAYKLLWLAVVAYPLWRAGTLQGSPAEGLAGTFLSSQVAILVIPWKYVFRTYVMRPHKLA